MDVKAIREKLGLTQEELAQKLGVSWSSVARWEAGRGKPMAEYQADRWRLISDERRGADEITNSVLR